MPDLDQTDVGHEPPYEHNKPKVSSLIVLSGLLYKQESKFLRRWQLKEFLLMSTGQLKYRKVNSSEQFKSIILTSSSIASPVDVNDPAHRHPYSFLVLAHLKGQQRIIYLAATNTETRLLWIQSINNTIKAVSNLKASSPLLLFDIKAEDELHRGGVYYLKGISKESALPHSSGVFSSLKGKASNSVASYRGQNEKILLNSTTGMPAGGTTAGTSTHNATSSNPTATGAPSIEKQPKKHRYSLSNIFRRASSQEPETTAGSPPTTGRKPTKAGGVKWSSPTGTSDTAHDTAAPRGNQPTKKKAGATTSSPPVPMKSQVVKRRMLVLTSNALFLYKLKKVRRPQSAFDAAAKKGVKPPSKYMWRTGKVYTRSIRISMHTTCNAESNALGYGKFVFSLGNIDPSAIAAEAAAATTTTGAGGQPYTALSPPPVQKQSSHPVTTATAHSHLYTSTPAAMTAETKHPSGHTQSSAHGRGHSIPAGSLIATHAGVARPGRSTSVSGMHHPVVSPSTTTPMLGRHGSQNGSTLRTSRGALSFGQALTSTHSLASSDHHHIPPVVPEMGYEAPRHSSSSNIDVANIHQRMRSGSVSKNFAPPSPVPPPSALLNGKLPTQATDDPHGYHYDDIPMSLTEDCLFNDCHLVQYDVNHRCDASCRDSAFSRGTMAVHYGLGDSYQLPSGTAQYDGAMTPLISPFPSYNNAQGTVFAFPAETVSTSSSPPQQHHRRPKLGYPTLLQSSPSNDQSPHIANMNEFHDLYFFACDSEEERDRWIFLIQQCIQQHADLYMKRYVLNRGLSLATYIRSTTLPPSPDPRMQQGLQGKKEAATEAQGIAATAEINTTTDASSKPNSNSNVVPSQSTNDNHQRRPSLSRTATTTATSDGIPQQQQRRRGSSVHPEDEGKENTQVGSGSLKDKSSLIAASSAGGTAKQQSLTNHKRPRVNSLENNLDYTIYRKDNTALIQELLQMSSYSNLHSSESYSDDASSTATPGAAPPSSSIGDNKNQGGPTTQRKDSATTRPGPPEQSTTSAGKGMNSPLVSFSNMRPQQETSAQSQLGHIQEQPSTSTSASTANTGTAGTVSGYQPAHHYNRNYNTIHGIRELNALTVYGGTSPFLLNTMDNVNTTITGGSKTASSSSPDNTLLSNASTSDPTTAGGGGSTNAGGIDHGLIDAMQQTITAQKQLSLTLEKSKQQTLKLHRDQEHLKTFSKQQLATKLMQPQEATVYLKNSPYQDLSSQQQKEQRGGQLVYPPYNHDDMRIAPTTTGSSSSSSSSSPLTALPKTDPTSGGPPPGVNGAAWVYSTLYKGRYSQTPLEIALSSTYSPPRHLLAYHHHHQHRHKTGQPQPFGADHGAFPGSPTPHQQHQSFFGHQSITIPPPAHKNDLYYTYERQWSGYIMVSTQNLTEKTLFTRKFKTMITNQRLYAVLSRGHIYLFHSERDSSPQSYLAGQRPLHCSTLFGCMIDVTTPQKQIQANTLQKQGSHHHHSQHSVFPQLGHTTSSSSRPASSLGRAQSQQRRQYETVYGISSIQGMEQQQNQPESSSDQQGQDSPLLRLTHRCTTVIVDIIQFPPLSGSLPSEKPSTMSNALSLSSIYADNTLFSALPNTGITTAQQQPLDFTKGKPVERYTIQTETFQDFEALLTQLVVASQFYNHNNANTTASLDPVSKEAGHEAVARAVAPFRGNRQVQSVLLQRDIDVDDLVQRTIMGVSAQYQRDKLSKAQQQRAEALQRQQSKQIVPATTAGDGDQPQDGSKQPSKRVTIAGGDLYSDEPESHRQQQQMDPHPTTHSDIEKHGSEEDDDDNDGGDDDDDDTSLFSQFKTKKGKKQQSLRSLFDMPPEFDTDLIIHEEPSTPKQPQSIDMPPTQPPGVIDPHTAAMGSPSFAADGITPVDLQTTTQLQIEVEELQSQLNQLLQQASYFASPSDPTGAEASGVASVGEVKQPQITISDILTQPQPINQSPDMVSGTPVPSPITAKDVMAVGNDAQQLPIDSTSPDGIPSSSPSPPANALEAFPLTFETLFNVGPSSKGPAQSSITVTPVPNALPNDGISPADLQALIDQVNVQLATSSQTILDLKQAQTPHDPMNESSGVDSSVTVGQIQPPALQQPIPGQHVDEYAPPVAIATVPAISGSTDTTANTMDHEAGDAVIDGDHGEQLGSTSATAAAAAAAIDATHATIISSVLESYERNLANMTVLPKQSSQSTTLAIPPQLFSALSDRFDRPASSSAHQGSPSSPALTTKRRGSQQRELGLPPSPSPPSSPTIKKRPLPDFKTSLQMQPDIIDISREIRTKLQQHLPQKHVDEGGEARGKIQEEDRDEQDNETTHSQRNAATQTAMKQQQDIDSNSRSKDSSDDDSDESETETESDSDTDSSDDMTNPESKSAVSSRRVETPSGQSAVRRKPRRKPKRSFRPQTVSLLPRPMEHPQYPHNSVPLTDTAPIHFHADGAFDNDDDNNNDDDDDDDVDGDIIEGDADEENDIESGHAYLGPRTSDDSSETLQPDGGVESTQTIRRWRRDGNQTRRVKSSSALGSKYPHQPMGQDAAQSNRKTAPPRPVAMAMSLFHSTPSFDKYLEPESAQQSQTKPSHGADDDSKHDSAMHPGKRRSITSGSSSFPTQPGSQPLITMSPGLKQQRRSLKSSDVSGRVTTTGGTSEAMTPPISFHYALGNYPSQPLGPSHRTPSSSMGSFHDMEDHSASQTTLTQRFGRFLARKLSGLRGGPTSQAPSPSPAGVTPQTAIASAPADGMSSGGGSNQSSSGSFHPVHTSKATRSLSVDTIVHGEPPQHTILPTINEIYIPIVLLKSTNRWLIRTKTMKYESKYVCIVSSNKQGHPLNIAIFDHAVTMDNIAQSKPRHLLSLAGMFISLQSLPNAVLSNTPQVLTNTINNIDEAYCDCELVTVSKQVVAVKVPLDEFSIWADYIHIASFELSGVPRADLLLYKHKEQQLILLFAFITYAMYTQTRERQVTIYQPTQQASTAALHDSVAISSPFTGSVPTTASGSSPQFIITSSSQQQQQQQQIRSSTPHYSQLEWMRHLFVLNAHGDLLSIYPTQYQYQYNHRPLTQFSLTSSTECSTIQYIDEQSVGSDSNTAAGSSHQTGSNGGGDGHQPQAPTPFGTGFGTPSTEAPPPKTVVHFEMLDADIYRIRFILKLSVSVTTYTRSTDAADQDAQSHSHLSLLLSRSRSKHTPSASNPSIDQRLTSHTAQNSPGYLPSQGPSRDHSNGGDIHPAAGASGAGSGQFIEQVKTTTILLSFPNNASQRKWLRALTNGTLK